MHHRSIIKGIALLSSAAFSLLLFDFSQPVQRVPIDPPESEAWDAFEWWYGQRSQPFESIPTNAYQQAFTYSRTMIRKGGEAGSFGLPEPEWQSLGPINIGGRVLSIAIDPESTNIVWVGSASGGLWRTATAGVGSTAWGYVNTGFPTLCVSAIAIDPLHPDTIYIGTGEVSLYNRPLVGTPGARASYGMGILISTDGGLNWSQTGLTWTFPDITAVQRIIINPINTATIIAATSEGIFKSTDHGTTWTQTLSEPMAMDAIMMPSDTNIVVASCGNLNSTPNPGMYRSTDGGNSWAEVLTGLPPANFGRTALATCPAAPSLVLAGVADAAASDIIGIYKSTNAGMSWSLLNTTNYVGSQGWFDNVVAIKPTDPSIVYAGGFDIHKSTDGGTTFQVKSTNVVHVDQHAMAFDPSNPNIMYFGCDGGIYKSTTGGESFINQNNNFLTTQFFGGFATSFSDTSIALGGLQDNGTLKYQGTGFWTTVYDGDGGWCAIDPTNPNIMYYQSQFLSIQKSTNGGVSRTQATSGLPNGPNNANFIAPLVLSQSSPAILYSGNKSVYKSTNSAASWFAPNGGAALNGTKVSCIAVSSTSPDTLMAGTGASDIGTLHLFQIFSSTNGGQSWSNVTDTMVLPNRFPTDIEFDPTNSASAYLTYSGYGSGHLFKTTNVGASWTNITSNLPDLPHQSIAIDPVYPNHIYVGNDLGVYRSIDAGGSWEEYGAGMPQTMVTDLRVSEKNNALRAATFGNGIYQRRLLRIPLLSVTIPDGGEIWVAGETEAITWQQKFVATVRLEYSIDSAATWNVIDSNISGAAGSYAWTLPDVMTEGAQVRVIGVGDGVVIDSSAAFFTILRNPDILNGWNLISLPVAVADTRTLSIYPQAVSAAYGYINGYLQRDTLETGIGYWLKFPSAGFAPLSGDSILNDTINIKSGWNLIGAVTTPIATSNLVTDPPDVISSQYFGYRGGYSIVDTLTPGRGSWVKANADGQLIFGTGTRTVLNIGGIVADASSLRNSLEFSDGAGRRQVLYFGFEAGETISAWELPPMPPSGGFDVRFSSNRMFEPLVGGLGVPIQLSSPAYPVTISWTTAIPATLTIDREQISLVGSGSLVLQKPSAITLSKLSGRVPAGGIRLHTNYPNPFNPVTTIRYEVPSRSRVKVVLYDMTGKEVATLVDVDQEVGIHEAVWDAEASSSGVYLVRISIPGSQASGKIVLMR